MQAEVYTMLLMLRSVIYEGCILYIVSECESVCFYFIS